MEREGSVERKRRAKMQSACIAHRIERHAVEVAIL